MQEQDLLRTGPREVVPTLCFLMIYSTTGGISVSSSGNSAHDYLSVSAHEGEWQEFNRKNEISG